MPVDLSHRENAAIRICCYTMTVRYQVCTAVGQPHVSGMLLATTNDLRPLVLHRYDMRQEEDENFIVKLIH